MGNSLAVQWLGLHAFTSVARVQSLVGELRSLKTCGMTSPQKLINLTKFRLNTSAYEHSPLKETMTIPEQ